MKILSTVAILFFGSILSQANAQTEMPPGFKKGTITLADNSAYSGFVKDNIRKNASVIFLADANQKKKNYDGSQLKSAEIDGVKFICIKGDFFKVLCEGDLSFLQKSSDASGKPTYYGNEAVFISGTEGSPNDYFIYDGTDKQLKLISKKNINEVAAASFTGCTAAIDKAKTISNDLSQLKQAVEIFNDRNK